MRRSVVAAADALKCRSREPAWWCCFVTLTYRPGASWRPKHMSLFLEALRNELGRRVPLRYVWVMELTRAGVPHYHVALWLPSGTKLAKPDQSGAWPHGSTRIERARAPVGYLIKYATKGSSTLSLPRGARLYGAGGLGREARAEVRWWLLPNYVRRHCQPGDHVVRFKTGGWVSMSTGEWWPSPVAYLENGRVAWRETG